MIAPVRSEAAKESLILEVMPGQESSAKQRLVLLMVDCGTPQGAEAIAANLKKHGRVLDHVVSSFGGDWTKGPASVLTPADLHKALDRATPHLMLAQALLPVMKQAPSSSYTIITGMLGERCFNKDFAALTIANSAIYGIVQAIKAEIEQRPVRLYEMRIGALLRKDSTLGHPFTKGGTAYSATLIGEQAVDFAVGKQPPGIVRIGSDTLAAKQTAAV